MRGHTWPVEAGFRLLERDTRSAGGVLGGGLAYRLFFWTLALIVLVAGALGFRGEDEIRDGARSLSLGESLTDSIADAARQSQSGRWWLFLVGLWLVVWFAWSLLRAVRLVHAEAWGVHPGRATGPPIGILGMLAVPVILVVVSAVTGVIRSELGPLSGIAAFTVGSALLGAMIVLGATFLPAPEVPWTAHVPGAVALVVVLQGLSLLGQVYLAERLADSQALYGALGLGATFLFVLYIIGRGVVWACELNAVTWEVRRERSAQARAAGGEAAGG